MRTDIIGVMRNKLSLKLFSRVNVTYKVETADQDGPLFMSGRFTCLITVIIGNCSVGSWLALRGQLQEPSADCWLMSHRRELLSISAANCRWGLYLYLALDRGDIACGGSEIFNES